MPVGAGTYLKSQPLIPVSPKVDWGQARWAIALVLLAALVAAGKADVQVLIGVLMGILLPTTDVMKRLG